jgi:hypothetical protein
VLFEEELTPGSNGRAVDELAGDSCVGVIGESTFRVEKYRLVAVVRGLFGRRHAPSLPRCERSKPRSTTTAPKLAAAILLAGAAVAAVSAQAASTPTLHLDVGDRFEVEAAAVGCRVTRIAAFGGRPGLDCRRAGPLAGSYGTLLSAREALIVRYRSAGMAKVVYEARHEGNATRCR